MNKVISAQIKHFLSICLVCAFSIYATEKQVDKQTQDRLYFDQYWYQSTAENARYYRPYPLAKSSDLFVIKDYYLDGTLQMQGYSKTPEDFVLVGEATWYDITGKLSEKRVYNTAGKTTYEEIYYQNGQLRSSFDKTTGSAKSYYPNGQLETNSVIINNRYQGKVESYFEDGTLRSSGTVDNNGFYFNGTFVTNLFPYYQTVDYKDGKQQAINSYYADSKTLAERRQFSLSQTTGARQFFDRKGNLLSTSYFKVGRDGRDYFTEGVSQLFSYNNSGLVIDIIGQSEFETNDGITTIYTDLKNYPDVLIGSQQNEGHFSGNLYDEKTGAISQFVDNIKDGIEICCFNQNNINAKGTYQSGQPFEGGFFNYDQKTLSHYQNGLYQGEMLSYDDNYNIIASSYYQNGNIEGKRITYDEKNNNRYESKYQNGVPISGDVFSHDQLNSYQAGVLYSQMIFDDKGNPTQKTIYHLTEPYGTNFIDFYRNGKIEQLDYQDGVPFNGRLYSSDTSFVTITEGQTTGPYFTDYGKEHESGNYQNGIKHGEIIFTKENGDSYHATFIDGKPMDGVVYDISEDTKFSYQNGKKNGEAIFYGATSPYFSYDKAVVTYQDDILIGTAYYYQDDKEIAQGTYQDGKPFDGEFYTQNGYQKLKQGELVRSTEFLDSYIKKRDRWYEDGILSTEKVTDNHNNKTYQLSYQNGQAWEGELLQLINDEKDRRYVITHYQSGLKQGNQTIYNDLNRPPIQTNHYENDVLDGRQYYYFYDDYFENSTTFIATYQNGKPIEGDVVTPINYRDFNITHFSSGKLESSQLIRHDGFNNTQTTLFAGHYQNNSPYDGYFYQKDEQTNQQINQLEFYQAGKPVTVYFSPYFNDDGSINAFAELNLGTDKDSVTYRSNETAIFTYQDSEKQIGKVSYFDSQNNLVGEIAFDHGNLTHAKGEFNNSWPGRFYYAKYKDKLLISLDQILWMGNYPIDFTGSANIALVNLADFFQPTKNQSKSRTFHYYYQDMSFPIAFYIIENNKIKSGTYIKPNEDNTYTFEFYKDSKLTNTESMPMDVFINQQSN